jgi:outer membrane protein TolC
MNKLPIIWLLLAPLVVCPLRNAYAQDLDSLPVINNSSLTYRDALLFAMHNNLDIKIAEGNVKSSTAGASVSKTQLQPSLSATTYGAYGDSANVLTSSPNVSPQNIFVAPAGAFADQNFTLSIPLFTGSKLQKQSLSSRLGLKSAEFTASDSQLATAETVIEDYANAALDKQLIESAQARLDSENEQVRITGQNVTQGHSAPVELLREQAEQSDATQALLAAQNNEQLALVALKDVLGVSQLSTIAVSDNLDILAGEMPIPSSLNAVMTAARTTAPALQSASYAALSAAADTAAAKSSFEPQVYGVVMSDSTVMRGPSHSGYTIGLAASLPLYDAGERQDQVDQAKAKQEIAADQVKKIRQQIESASASAWWNVQSASAEEESAAKGVTAAQQSYTLADLRYNAGKSIAAERLDALAALVRVQSTLATAKVSLIIAKAKLVQAIGSPAM